ncbi:fibronectin type III domain-containing protein [Flavobacterium ardleyense]|uniref:fibronectin type III domain-containing protein n=1 Tax=Flavobacterium ardleyense TaxID=2038737 RepID=UPI00298CBBFB|nr:fibronectin type III domain-containing protein [Flavobacterium ardleyense]
MKNFYSLAAKNASSLCKTVSTATSWRSRGAGLFMAALMLSAFGQEATAQISVGTGTITSSTIPVATNWGYTYSQQLYFQSEINAAGGITSISFKPKNTTIPANWDKSKDWVVYVGHTSKTNFNSTTDWIPTSAMTQVFAGEVSYPEDLNGNVVVTFTTPFMYNNVDNLVIAIDQNTADYGTGVDWAATSYGTNNYRGLYHRSDSTNLNPDSPIAGNRSITIANITLGGIQVSCPAPSDIVVSNVTYTTASVNWTAAAGAATGYAYEVRTSGAPGSGATGLAASGTTAAGVTSAAITGLVDNASYVVYVKAVCSAVESSSWTSIPAFQTPCLATNIPYELPLTSVTAPAIPSCVIVENVNNDDKTWITNSSITGMTGAAMQYPYHGSNAANDWFFTQKLNLTAGVGYKLMFKHRASGYEEKLKVAIGSEPSAATMTTPLFNVVIPSTPNQTVPVEVDFTVTTTGVYNIGFQAYSNANMNSLYVGDISVVAGPTCFPPTAIITTNLDKNSATIAWTEPNIIPANGYSYEIRTSGEAGSGATGLVVSGATAAGVVTADIAGLLPGTEYFLYVSSNCEATDQSAWSAGVTFSTLCDYLEIEAVNDTTCVGSTATLQVTGATTEVKWYATEFSTEVLESGPVFETPTLAETTSYFAHASVQAENQQLQVGAGNAVTTTYQNPFYSLWSNNHTQHIVLASELIAAGLNVGPISAVGLNVTNAGTLPMKDFTLKIGTTTQISVSNFVDNSSFVVVNTSASLMPVLGLNMIQFSTPYQWDGTSNIILEFCHGNSSSSATMSRVVEADVTSFDSTVKSHLASAATGAESCGDTTTSKTSYKLRPTFTFAGTTICEAPTRTEVIATVNEIPVIVAQNVQTITVDALEDATLANLDPLGPNVNWFPTMADAIAFTNELEIGTQLNSGTTYYAVLTENDCRSLPFAVLVTVQLGIADQTMNGLTYYPNPVQNQVNINYSEDITSISIFNLVGQKVMNVTPNASNVILDMSSLAAGTYLIHVNAHTASKMIKLIKK